jgi:hypothetical protein
MCAAAYINTAACAQTRVKKYKCAWSLYVMWFLALVAPDADLCVKSERSTAASEQYGPEPAQTDFIEAVKRILYIIFYSRMPWIRKRERDAICVRVHSF